MRKRGANGVPHPVAQFADQAQSCRRAGQSSDSRKYCPDTPEYSCPMAQARWLSLAEAVSLIPDTHESVGPPGTAYSGRSEPSMVRCPRSL